MCESGLQKQPERVAPRGVGTLGNRLCCCLVIRQQHVTHTPICAGGSSRTVRQKCELKSTALEREEDPMCRWHGCTGWFCVSAWGIRQVRVDLGRAEEGER